MLNMKYSVVGACFCFLSLAMPTTAFRPHGVRSGFLYQVRLQADREEDPTIRIMKEEAMNPNNLALTAERMKTMTPEGIGDMIKEVRKWFLLCRNMFL